MLKVGDEVRVREDLSHENNYGIDGEMAVDSSMENYCGERVTITEVVNSDAEFKYHINKDSCWFWTEDMFEPHMYSTGDIVTVKENLKAGFSYGSDTFIDDMEDNRGKTFCIASVKADEKYKLCDMVTGEILPYNYTSEMFVKREEKEMDAVEERVIAQFPEINVPDRDDSEYIERCVDLECDLYDSYSCKGETFVAYPYNIEYVREANEFSNNNKKKLNDLFSRHPLWDNRTHSIVMDCKIERKIIKDDINKFFEWIKQKLFDITEEGKIDGITYKEAYNAYEQLLNIKSAFDCLTEIQSEDSTICGYTKSDAFAKYGEQKSLLREFKDKFYLLNYGFEDKLVTAENKRIYDETERLLSKFLYDTNLNKFVTDSYAEAIKEFETTTGIELNAVAGKKISKVINTLCVALELNKINDWKITASGRDYNDGYSRQFAKFADAVNPMTFDQKLIISTDRIAFLTASFGNGWSSCYTIDKSNKRGVGTNNHSGCYSGGTTSYGSDETTFVLYTIDNSYTGEEPVLEDKLNRCFFSLGEGKIIQSRNYPDGRDGGDTSLAKQFREIVQNVVSECYDIPNLWLNRKGTDECENVIIYEGAGYHDHFNYSDCNVSYWKGDSENTEINTNRIILGSMSVCPSCGDKTDHDECVICGYCWDNEPVTYCEECGCEIYGDEIYEIDGRYYCEDCCFYCEYHNCYELGEYIYIKNYGNVCEDAAFESGDFYMCDCCKDYYCINDLSPIYASDGAVFCCDACAGIEDYVMCEDDGQYRKDAYWCEKCEAYYSYEAFNHDLDMCNNCAENADTEVA